MAKITVSPEAFLRDGRMSMRASRKGKKRVQLRRDRSQGEVFVLLLQKSSQVRWY